MQVHQTKYLMEVGFLPTTAAGALGLVAFAGIAGQITVGYLSDRIGREWAWSVGSAGFVFSYAALLLMHAQPMVGWLYVMIAAQGFLGYGLTAVYGTIPAEIFEGRHYGTIFGILSLASGVGAALGPWVTGVLHDLTGVVPAAAGIGENRVCVRPQSRSPQTRLVMRGSELTTTLGSDGNARQREPQVLATNESR
jgi:MFS family permease